MWTRFIPLSWFISCGRDLYLYLDSLHVDEIYTSILIHYMWTRTILLSWFIKWVIDLFTFIIIICAYDFIKYFIIVYYCFIYPLTEFILLVFILYFYRLFFRLQSALVYHWHYQVRQPSSASFIVYHSFSLYFSLVYGNLSLLVSRLLWNTQFVISGICFTLFYYFGLLWELQWSLSSRWIFIYRFCYAGWFWGSSVSRGDFAEISAKVLVEFFQGGTHRGCNPVIFY